MNKLFNSLVLVSAMVSGVAYSEEVKTTFFVDHDVLSIMKSNTKVDGADNQYTNELVSQPYDVLISAFWAEFGLYAKPQTRGGDLGASYFINPAWELGLLFRFNESKNNAAEVSDTDTIQLTKVTNRGQTLFSTYYWTIDDKNSMEFGGSLIFDQSKKELRSLNRGSHTSDDSKSSKVGALVQYVRVIAPHVSVVPGIYYEKGTRKETVSNVKAKLDYLQLNILHFRYIF